MAQSIVQVQGWEKSCGKKITKEKNVKTRGIQPDPPQVLRPDTDSWMQVPP
jgi:hypothetical protein